MATINDVAKLAGVSHGTVSKVLNHVPSVSIEKIKKVERAVAILGYTPNNFATNLKNARSRKVVVVILPTLGDAAVNSIYEGVERMATLHDYEINLYFTHDLIPQERKIIQEVRGYNFDKVILMTCQPQATDYFGDLAARGMSLVFVQRRVEGFNFVGISIKDEVAACVRNRIQAGEERIALISGPREYSFEAECIEGYMKAMFFADRQIRQDHILTGSFNQESAMRNAVQLLNMPAPPQTILLTNDILMCGARKAVDLIYGREQARPNLICFSNKQWWRVDFPFEQELSLPFGQIGERAFEMIHAKPAAKGDGAPKTVLICPERRPQEAAPPARFRAAKIRALLQSGQMGATSLSLLDNFRRKTGIEVEIDQRSAPCIQEEVFKNCETRKYDVYCIEASWLRRLATEGHIACLEPYLGEADTAKNYPEKIFEVFSRIDGRIYALPFSYTAQLLFYRKDLFEDLKTQRQYYEMYRAPLRVPTTWEEYNRVARFFTRSFNPASATMYGTSVAGIAASGAFGEYLPRAWSMGSNILRNDLVDPQDEAAVRALKNYMECAMYAHPAAKDWWWPEAAQEFASGSTAMAVLYSDRATNIVDRNLSKIVGKIGHGFIPENTSMMGGRSICMSAFSQKQEEAAAFIQWIAGESTAMANAVLGRIVPRQSIYNNDDLANLYPWHKDTFRAFETIGRCEVPASLQEKGLLASDLLRVIGAAAHAAISGRMTAEAALREMKQQFDALL